MGNGTQLNMLFSCAPWLSLERINDMLTQLEVSLQTDSSDKESCVYIIGIATDASREEVTFRVRSNTFIHRPEARVSINGESTYNTGSRAHTGQFWNTAEVGMARFTAMRAMRMLRIRLIILCLWIATKNATH